jgi:anti-sigma B factor antagonist
MTARDLGGHAVLALRGELDLAGAPAAAARLADAIAASGPRVIMDLAGLEYVGYCGLGILLRVRKLARDSGGDLTLAAPPQPVRRILLATGLIDVFAVYPSVAAAAGAPGPGCGRAGRAARAPADSSVAGEAGPGDGAALDGGPDDELDADLGGGPAECPALAARWRNCGEGPRRTGREAAECRRPVAEAALAPARCDTRRALRQAGSACRRSSRH